MVYIGWRNRQSPAALEDRLHRLEVRVTSLTEALRVLAHGLKDQPATGPEGKHAAGAARQACDLLLVAEPHQQLPCREDAMAGGLVTVFACGDVMLGRGVDQILPHPGDPPAPPGQPSPARVRAS